MKFLGISSYICSIASVFILVLLHILLHGTHPAILTRMLALLPFIVPVTQFLYTRRTLRAIDFPEYKSTQSIDDFSMNESEIDDEVIENHFWIRIAVILNTACYAVVGYLFIQTLPYSLVFQGDFSMEALANFFTVAEYIIILTLGPTIVFNLRTYRLSRVIRK